MRLKKASEWRLYAEDPNTKERCEFLLTHVPPIVAERLYRQCYGDDIEVRRKKGEEITTFEVEAARKYALGIAEATITDSRGYDHLVDSEEQAKLLQGLGPSFADVRVGDYVRLDGAENWTPALKRSVLEGFAGLVNWANAEFGTLSVRGASSEGKD